MNRNEMRELLDRARRKDRAALDQILRSVQGRLRGAASARLTRLIRGRMGTSDLLQSAYVSVVRAIDTFKGNDEDAFMVWVLRIMENNVQDKARFFGRAKRQLPDAPNVELKDEIDPSDATPSQHAIRIEHLVFVSRVLEALPESQRRVVELRMIEERSFEEIARMMKRSEGAVRMLLCRARAAMALEMDLLIDES